MIADEPIVAIGVDDVTATAGIVVAIEAVGVVPVIVTGALTVDSDTIVNVVGVTVVSAKYINA